MKYLRDLEEPVFPYYLYAHLIETVSKGTLCRSNATHGSGRMHSSLLSGVWKKKKKKKKANCEMAQARQGCR